MRLPENLFLSFFTVFYVWLRGAENQTQGLMYVGQELYNWPAFHFELK
jgi:hypothetical protein